MIYSTSMYFNGMEDLLDLKIAEEREHVDRIVIVESEVTHSGIWKGLVFPKEKYRNDPKIMHMAIDEALQREKCKTAWERERFQRDFPRSQLDIKDDDCLIVADLDEIVQREEIERLIGLAQEFEFVSMEMPLYYYYINVYRGRWRGPFVCSGRLAKRYSFNELYNKACGKKGYKYVWPDPIVVKIRGRHFSYLFDAEGIALKIKGMAHTEFNREEFSNVEKIKGRMKGLSDLFDRGSRDQKFEVVEIDDTYPKAILDDLGHWEKYIYRENPCST